MEADHRWSPYPGSFDWEKSFKKTSPGPTCSGPALLGAGSRLGRFYGKSTFHILKTPRMRN